MNDLEFIKRFSKITIKNACEKAGIASSSNLWAGRVAPEKIARVKDILIIEFLNLIQDDLTNEVDS